jgi:Holliday junction resolvasome RuvABC endonuclease subunit
MSRKRLPAARGFPSIQEIRGNQHPVRVKVKGKTPTGRAARRKPVTLCLDLSSSCIGWCVGQEPAIINFGKLVFTDDREMGERLAAFAEYLSVLFETYSPDRVLVEKPVARRGATTALHNQILGVVRCLAFTHLDLNVLDRHLIPPRTVKTTLEVPAGDNHDHNKLLMVEQINRTLGLNLQFSAHSKLTSDDDTADALAILLTSWTRKV